MRIGGLQPMTLSDYPGQIAAVVFTQGCNFRCPFCHNSSLLPTDPPGKTLMATGCVLAFLEARQKLLDAVVITGGEPTLQPDLATFIDRIRHKGLKVKLDTNGSRPAVLRELISTHALECVAMDVKAPLEKYGQLAGIDTSVQNIRDSVALLAESDTPCEFRTTYVPSLLTTADLCEIRSYLPRAARHTVLPFVPDNAMDPSLRSPTRPSVDNCGPMSLNESEDWKKNIPHHFDILSGE